MSQLEDLILLYSSSHRALKSHTKMIYYFYLREKKFSWERFYSLKSRNITWYTIKDNHLSFYGMRDGHEPSYACTLLTKRRILDARWVDVVLIVWEFDVKFCKCGHSFSWFTLSDLRCMFHKLNLRELGSFLLEFFLSSFIPKLCQFRRVF